MTRRAARLIRAERARRLPLSHTGFGYSRDMDMPVTVPVGVELICLSGRQTRAGV